MIGLTWPKTNAAMLACVALLCTGFYLKGRSDAAEKCARIQAQTAFAVIEEKQLDDEAQQSAAAAADVQLRNEIARLNRQLEINHVKTGLACDAPGSGDSVRDAWGALFEEGLPPGRGSDDGGTGASPATMETGQSSERR